MRRFLRWLFSPRAKGPRRAAGPPDPRVAADPWLAGVFARLGERYQLGPDGSQILRRTGRARFNPMPVWVQPVAQVVRASYEVRGDPSRARALLDERVGGALGKLGLSGAGDKVEDWAGSVLTRTYEGRCETPEAAAAAVQFACEQSETQINLAAE